MADEPGSYDVRALVAAVESFFKARVRQVSAPGGRSRRSFRVHFADRTIIVTDRRDTARTRHEAAVLTALAPLCDDVPKVLGMAGSLLFQSDVGSERLSQRLHAGRPEDHERLCRAAIAGIFGYQRAARRTDLMATLPRLGASPEWLAHLAARVDALARLAGVAAPDFDREAAIARLDPPQHGFVKWDCRAGNAAIDGSGRLRWFDFEYAGTRHGAEDFAWLIGDEYLPVAPAIMLGLVRDQYRPEDGTGADAYLDYLAFYSTFHAIQRLCLVIGEARRRGWLSRRRILRHDDVGVRPEFGLRLCRTALALADMDRLTRPLLPLLQVVTQNFEAVMAQADATPAPPVRSSP